MPQSLAAIYIHVVFGTKGRAPLLADASLREEMHRYLGGVANHENCQVLIVGGTDDHVHVLVRLVRTATVANLVKEPKRVSTIWVRQRLPEFSWQAGYGAFSVGHREVEVVRAYIRNQEEHHRNLSFQEEYRAMMQEHGLELDERYVWD
jgi:REP element-mobilizing transposase RayT